MLSYCTSTTCYPYVGFQINTFVICESKIYTTLTFFLPKKRHKVNPFCMYTRSYIWWLFFNNFCHNYSLLVFKRLFLIIQKIKFFFTNININCVKSLRDNKIVLNCCFVYHISRWTILYDNCYWYLIKNYASQKRLCDYDSWIVIK